MNSVLGHPDVWDAILPIIMKKENCEQHMCMAENYVAIAQVDANRAGIGKKLLYLIVHKKYLMGFTIAIIDCIASNSSNRINITPC